MLQAWSGLRDDLAHDDGSRWTAEHGELAVHLTGRESGGFGIAWPEALSRAIGGDFSLLSPEDGSGLDPGARREWSRRAMLTRIDAAAEKLAAHRETLNFEAIEADRAGAAALALFDPSKEATLARKYEAAADRQMHRALKEMKAIEAEAKAADRGQPLPSLGSFSPPIPARPLAPAPTPAPVPPGTRFTSDEGSTYVPITIGRPGKGKH